MSINPPTIDAALREAIAAAREQWPHHSMAALEAELHERLADLLAEEDEE